MTVTDIVRDLAAMTEPRRITRENIDQLLDSNMIEQHMKSGAWWAIRRNGKSRHWKKDPNRIYVPFKHGFRGYGAVSEVDFTGPGGSLPTEFYRVKPN